MAFFVLWANKEEAPLSHSNWGNAIAPIAHDYMEQA